MRLDWKDQAILTATLALAVACGTLESPAGPEPEHSSVSSADGQGTLGAAATPTPSPSASASPSTPPEGDGEASGDCGSPLPPAVSKMDVKVHQRGSGQWILDSTPLVGPDAAYCLKIGFTDGRAFCAVRPEGNPQRAACELYAIGRAKDSGRPGPTWYRNEQLCTGDSSGCLNHPDNQYLLIAYGNGTYRACAQSGVCGSVEVAR